PFTLGRTSLRKAGSKLTFSKCKSSFLKLDAIEWRLLENPLFLSSSLTNFCDSKSLLSNNVADEENTAGRKVREVGRENLANSPSSRFFIINTPFGGI